MNIHAPVSPSTVALPGPFTHTMLHARGLRLHAATAGDPSDPLILLIHGTFGAWLDFRHVIAPLARHGFHVAAVDMRGYGMSDKPPSRPGDDTLLAVGDIDGVITALGHVSAHLVGHDTGGAMSWVYSAAYPNRVDSLISVSAAHPHDLRSHMMRRPWELAYMCTRVGVGRLPVWVHQRFAGLLPGIWRHELRINTNPAFHGTDEFAESARLRIQAARIDNALRGIVHNSRLLTRKLISLPAGASSRAIGAPTQAPVLLMHPDQKVWDGVDRRARKRVSASVCHVSVPGAKNVPHLENPVGFVEEVARFLAAL